MFYLIVPAILLSIFERISSFRFRAEKFFRAYFLTDVVYLITGYIGLSWVFAASFPLVPQWAQSLWSALKLSSIELQHWILVIPALILLDLGNYLCHYCLHRFDWLWEFHKIHHSSPTMDWLATFRSHLLEQVFRRLLGPSLLILFGFPLSSILSAGGILIAWAMLNHSNANLNLSFIESILITPRMHRVHHLPQHSESNLGTVFTFWDRIRGTVTFVSTDESSKFGNGDPQYPQDWITQLIEPLRTRKPLLNWGNLSTRRSG